MNSNNEEQSVYGLVTELCKHLLEKTKVADHPYLPRKDDYTVLKKMRGRAFEILLKKTSSTYEDNGFQDGDPIVELLKYTFVLKNALQRFSRAKELETILDHLCHSEENLEPGAHSVLLFLNGLKSFETKNENILDVFHYGRPNPLFPEQPQNPKEVPRYKVYPIESFVIPERFDEILGIESDCSLADNAGNPRGSVSFESQFKSATTIGIETLSTRSERTIGSMLSTPRYTVRLVSTHEFSMSSYFMPQTMEDNNDERKNEYATGHIGFFPEPEPPWLCVKSARQNSDTNSETSDVQSTNPLYEDKSTIVGETSLEIWNNIDDCMEIKEHRNWETLGRFEAPKEPPFITESKDAMLHLERIKQAGILLLLPPNVVNSLNMITEVPTKEFMENIKLLLLGVESSTFVWNDETGFTLKRNTTISGLSVDALKSACIEITYWGNCYKSLCALIKPDPQTGKMQQEGLIFRAMCNSVKELLLYYQAVILRIIVKNENLAGLLSLLRNVRPVGSLIAEVARLCHCGRNDNETLGEGLGLLSHIYSQVTRITKPSVALVFYSILKSCCEVYFRFLQKWLFEGTCDDEYGEFMIKLRPQFVRDKGHSFWTKAFALNKNSVPGFLSHLTESILECGKTVRLLKICDSKNSLASIFATSHPIVRVCLSVGMVREQELICRDFACKGEKFLGQNISFFRAFEQQRDTEKKRAELVINAQRDTLLRIKREREEFKREEARNKRELLAQLKDQAEEVATRKEREKADELRKDKKYLEDMNAADEIAKNAEIAEKKNILDYYNELAAVADKRRARADWRTRRMKFFQKRVDSFNQASQEFDEIAERMIETFEDRKGVENESKKSEHAEMVDEKLNKLDSDIDENYAKSPETRSPLPAAVKLPMKHFEETKDVRTEIVSKKSPRPCMLDIKKNRPEPEVDLTNVNEIRENGNMEFAPKRAIDLRLNATENTSDAQRNKLKVLQEEYGMTPNNNEFNIIVVDAEGNKNTISIDASTINNDNIRKNREIEKQKNDNTQHQTDSWTSEIIVRRTNENLTGTEKNRNKNVISDQEFSRLPAEEEIPEMTEAQKNRKRNMTHTYRDLCTDANEGRVKFGNSTDLQKNRARVMGHDNRNYRDYEEINSVANCSDALTPVSQITDDMNVATPMSCTTDTFPTSVSGSSTHLYNCDDCFFGEKKNGARSDLETPADSTILDQTEDNNFSLRCDSRTKFFLLEAVRTPIFESSLTLADVEMIDNTSLQVYLEKSVAIPLRVQSRLANAAIVKHLIHDCKILSHLRSLRSFFFLLNGEFAKSLTNSLYTRLYETSQPIELFKSATLTNFLETALNSSLSSTYENSERLSLSATDIPSQLQVSNPEFLNCLCLNYKISWPLNIIIDERLMQQYSKVFKFLLMVGRVLYVLQEDFHLLKVERKATISSQYHKLQLYRHSMMQFVTALHNYLTCSVLNASWTEFEKELVNATTLDQIYLTHVNYVKKILSRCMLTARGEKMRNFLCNIFKIILQFHNRVRSQNWSSSSHQYGRVNFERLENMYKSFCDGRTYLAHVANKLASSGYQPHLTHFLNALNINPLYDLTEAASSKKTYVEQESRM